MLIINNLQKLDPSHVSAQPVTKPSHQRVEVEKPVLDGRFAPSAQKKRKALVGVRRRDFMLPTHALPNPSNGLANAFSAEGVVA
jgi:hypothetical protein